MPSATRTALNVAIIGSGPAGLAAAIALSDLPNITVRLFEQAPELKEIGAGISIGYNGWKVLELLGAADRIQGASTVPTVHRNGHTGEIVEPGIKLAQKDSLPVLPKRGPVRIPRTRLQNALAAGVPKGTIQFNKKLLSLENLEGQGVRLAFGDGTETTVDLVVGGDGIRSVVRQAILPGHRIKYTGGVAWRALIPVASLFHIRDLPLSTAWWHGPGGHVYFSPVDEVAELGSIELSCRSHHEPEIDGRTVSWGIPITNEEVLSHFKDYDPRLKEALSQVPEGQWREFSLFAGPYPERITGWGKVVIIGDASHPLAGAFGSGAAFAMEDGWVLARALENSRLNLAPLANALRIFDAIRAPYYLRMYQFRESQTENIKKQQDIATDFQSILRARAAWGIGEKGEGLLDWVHKNDIQKVWENYLEVEKRKEVR